MSLAYSVMKAIVLFEPFKSPHETNSDIFFLLMPENIGPNLVWHRSGNFEAMTIFSICF